MKFRQKAFSIIEILIVIALFSTLAIIVTQSLLRTFQGTRKVDAAGKVRDNLTFAADLMERHIRNAKSVTSACDSTSHATLTYTDQRGTTASFSCLNIGGADPYLASGSGNLRITSNEVTLTACSLTCRITSTVNPPIVDFTIAGYARGADVTDQSFATLTRRVVLRVY
jgi:prepilin-type N-terminal cleavage/methylation domain-containing protein